jgi:RND family efflux transporter MFP subunit
MSRININRPRLARVFVPTAAALALAVSAACGGGETPVAANTPATASVSLAPQNIATAAVAELASGPAVSGQLTPAREATVRAQVGGSIVTLTVDRGQTVTAGAVVARVAARDLDDALESAKAAVASAETALATAKSEEARTASLVKGGALAARDLEQAKNAVAMAEAQLAAARARQKSAWQQVDDTQIRAPFTGIVSDRPANLGDVVTPGAPILTVIDPSSLRLEALVPSDQIGQVKGGQRVRFSIRGFPNQTFTGKVERVSPTADPITRQVSIFVSLPNVGGKLIAGLFAEGRVESTVRKGVVVPMSAIDETGAITTVTRIRDGKAERAAVQLGLRQPETELVEIVSGVAAGDVVITGSAKGVAPGTIITVVK